MPPLTETRPSNILIFPQATNNIEVSDDHYVPYLLETEPFRDPFFEAYVQAKGKPRTPETYQEFLNELQLSKPETKQTIFQSDPNDTRPTKRQVPKAA